MEESFDTPDVTSDDKLWALLSWLLSPLLPIIVLILEDKKARPFIKYHAIQALAIGILNMLVSAILGPVIIGCFLGVGLFIYQIYLGIQAYNGEWVQVPFLTDFVKGQNWI